MYKAIIEIGGYNPGNVVPDEVAEIWSKMYKVSPVEQIEDEVVEKVSEPIIVQEKEKVIEEDNFEVMIDDYLGRNKSVVLSNLSKDNLSKKQLIKMLEFEKSLKCRKQVISTIENKIEDSLLH